MKVAAIVSLIAGLGAIAGLFLLSDPAHIWALIEQVAVWLVPLSIAHFVFVFLTTMAWRSLLVAQDMDRPLRELFRMRWIGDALSALTPFGIADGEAARAYLQAKETELDGPKVAAVVMVELTARLLSLVLFILVGILLLAIYGGRHVWLTAGGATALLVAGLGAYVYAQKHDWLHKLARKIGKRSKSEKWQELAGDTDAVNEHLGPIYGEHGAFLRCTGWHFAAWVFSAAEMMFLLWVLDTPAGPMEAWIFEAIGQAARNAGFFLPAALGAQEGGYYLGAKAIGKSSSVGVAVAIIKRARDIIFGVPALLLWQGHELKENKEEEEGDEGREAGEAAAG